MNAVRWALYIWLTAIAIASTTNTTFNKFDVAMSRNLTWFSVRQDLRYLICGGTGHNNLCPGDDYDFYVIDLDSIYEKRDSFVVSCNASWMLYQAVSIPTSALQEQEPSFVSIKEQLPLPSIADRGANQVMLTTVFTGSGGYLAKRWRPFAKTGYLVMKYLYGESKSSDMEIVNGSCTLNTENNYNCTWIASLKEISQQVEVAGINWESFDTMNVKSNYITSEALYPIGVDLDQGTANRINFLFIYTNIPHRYEPFKSFIQLLHQDSNEALRPTTNSAALLALQINWMSNGSAVQSFNVSFNTSQAHQAILQHFEPGSVLDNIILQSVQSPTTTSTPTAEPPSATKEPQDKKESVGLIIIIISAMIVVLVILVLVGRSLRRERRLAKEHAQQALHTTCSI